MRIATRFLAAAGLAAALASFGTAQDQPRQRPGGGGQGGPGGPGMLLINKAVQDDIKLTDDQKTKLADWAKENAPKARQKYEEAMKDVPQDEQRAKAATLRAEMAKETYKELETVLQPDQVKRVKQIEVQQAGPRAFTQPEVVEALKLTDDQKAKIKEIGEETRKDMTALREGGSRPEPSKVAGLTKEVMEKTAKVLTDDQQKAWKELTGEPFDTSKLNQGFGGGPGGRRPGGQQNRN